MSSIEGIPEGWELVRVGKPKTGEFFIDGLSCPHQAMDDEHFHGCAVIRKIKLPKQYRAFANAEEFKPYRDRWLARTDENGLRLDGEFQLDGFDDTGIWLGSNHLSYKDALDRGGVFDDGTPFGVEVTS